jgi:hypothetical protein
MHPVFNIDLTAQIDLPPVGCQNGADRFVSQPSDHGGTDHALVARYPDACSVEIEVSG